MDAMDINYDRNRIVLMWAIAGNLDLTDFSDAVRTRLLERTHAGWDRHLTITGTRWTYADLGPEAQERVNRSLTNSTTTQIGI